MRRSCDPETFVGQIRDILVEARKADDEGDVDGLRKCLSDIAEVIGEEPLHAA